MAVMENMHFKNRKDFRMWLKNNHNSSDGIWMIYYKDKVTPTIKYEEALEEALCYGWIDSLIKKIDDKIYIRKFTPRNTNSKWSEKNKSLADQLIENGKMTKYGLNLVSEAKKIGEWNKTQERPSDKISADDIDRFFEYLEKYPDEKHKFKKMNKSMQKEYAAYYFDAKKEETRQRRLEKIAENIKNGKTIF
jgi:uncharacterized protein YdeI (YjbR/CyaY-like superfamily)